MSEEAVRTETTQSARRDHAETPEGQGGLPAASYRFVLAFAPLSREVQAGVPRRSAQLSAAVRSRVREELMREGVRTCELAGIVPSEVGIVDAAVGVRLLTSPEKSHHCSGPVIQRSRQLIGNRVTWVADAVSGNETVLLSLVQLAAILRLGK